MAKAKKRATKSSARTKAVAKKSAAAKKTVAKRAPVPKKTAPKKAAPKSKPVAAKKTAAHSSTPAPARKPVERAVVTPQRPAPPASPAPTSKQTVGQDNSSPDSKKKLAAQHMWDLVQAKKQRAAQTPTWKTIVHHDHPAPRATPELPSDQGGSSPPAQMPGHRDRGTG